MPFPVLHSFVGISIYHFSKKKGEAPDWGAALFAVLLANLADFDFIPGLLAGDADLFHRLASHSIFAAVICGLLVACFARAFRRGSFSQTFYVATVLYGSHLFLDYFSGPKELPLLWPLSDQLFGAPFALFPVESVGFHGIANVQEFGMRLLDSRCLGRLFFEGFVVSILAGIMRYMDPVRLRMLLRNPLRETPFVGGLTCMLIWIVMVIR